ncbi:glycosylphosphatidylinositol anchor biosynthesis [Savitreella phatthalungensis]
MGRKSWRKVLWVKQDYPDNWVDQTFLNKLQRNANVVAYEYWPLVADSTVLSQHVCSVAIFVASFVGIYSGSADALIVVATATALTAAAYAFWSYHNEASPRMATEPEVPSHAPHSIHSDFLGHRRERLETAKSGLLIVLTILGLSPILISLTQSSDSDSIWTIAVYLFIANIAFHDYSLRRRHVKWSPSRRSTRTRIRRPQSSQRSGMSQTSISSAPPSAGRWPRSIRKDYSALTSSRDVSPIRSGALTPNELRIPAELAPMPMRNEAHTSISYSGNVSTNAAVMASVVLASRLGDSTSVFALILFAVEWFALFPIFRRFVRAFDRTLNLALTLLLIVSANLTLGIFTSWFYAYIFDIALFFVSFVCPLWLIQLQRYKNEISGPWDIAHPVTISEAPI